MFISIVYFRILVLCLFSLLFFGACSKPASIYQGLKPDQDGTIAVEIPEDGTEAPLMEPIVQRNILSQKELDLVKKWHEGDADKLSFIVVDAEGMQIIRSYYADLPQRLASISKLSTALSALENVRNVDVIKVAKMLKSSNNGEASRYVRLAAKALKGLVLPTKPYSQAHSCPNEFLNDEPAAVVSFDWIKNEISNFNWNGASVNDGAGCHYDNFMSAHQVTKILNLAAEQGDAYGGKAFEDLLSINGKDGTWKNKNLEHKGYIFAKTGTLNPNANLAGYFYAKRNGKFHGYYFSIFVNKKGGGSYSHKARSLIEGLMRHWIDYYSSNPGTVVAPF